MSCISASTLGVSGYSVLTELHEFPPVSLTTVGENNVVKPRPITCGALFAQAIQ